jgi:hypothetical protein
METEVKRIVNKDFISNLIGVPQIYKNPADVLFGCNALGGKQ